MPPVDPIIPDIISTGCDVDIVDRVRADIVEPTHAISRSTGPAVLPKTGLLPDQPPLPEREFPSYAALAGVCSLFDELSDGRDAGHQAIQLDVLIPGAAPIFLGSQLSPSCCRLDPKLPRRFALGSLGTIINRPAKLARMHHWETRSSIFIHARLSIVTPLIPRSRAAATIAGQ